MLQHRTAEAINLAIVIGLLLVLLILVTGCLFLAWHERPLPGELVTLAVGIGTGFLGFLGSHSRTPQRQTDVQADEAVVNVGDPAGSDVEAPSRERLN